MSPRILLSGLQSIQDALVLPAASFQFLCLPLFGPGGLEAWGSEDDRERLQETAELIGRIDTTHASAEACDRALDLDLDFLLAPAGDGESDRTRMPLRWIADQVGDEEVRATGAAWARRVALPGSPDAWERLAEVSRAERLILHLDPTRPEWRQAVRAIQPFAVDLANSENLSQILERGLDG